MEAGSALQQDVLTRLLEVEGDRDEFKRTVIRMSKKGKSPAPQPPALFGERSARQGDYDVTRVLLR